MRPSRLLISLSMTRRRSLRPYHLALAAYRRRCSSSSRIRCQSSREQGRGRAASIRSKRGSGLLQPGSTLPVTALGGAQGYSAKSAPAVVQNAPMSSSSSEEKASAAPSSSVRVASSDPPTTKASGSSAPGANVLKLSKSDASIESEMSSVDDGAPIQGTKDAIAKLDSLPNSPLKAPAAAAGRQIQGRRGSAGYGGPQLNTSIAPSKPLYGGGGGGAGGGSSGIGNKPLRMDKAGGEMALEDSLSSDDVDAFPQPRSLGGMGGGLGASRLAPRAAPRRRAAGAKGDQAAAAVNVADEIVGRVGPG